LFTPDGGTLITGTDDGKVGLFDVYAAGDGGSSAMLSGHEGAVVSLGITPNGRWLATGSEDKTVCLWDLGSENLDEPTFVLRQDYRVDKLSISADGHWLITTEFDHARLWDLSAPDPSAASIILRGHKHYLSAAAFTPNGRWVVTADGVFGVENKPPTAIMWTLRMEDLLRDARRAVGRNLDFEEWSQYLSEQPYRRSFPEILVPRDDRSTET
jgi:WD40 repeat protein